MDKKMILTGGGNSKHSTLINKNSLIKILIVAEHTLFREGVKNIFLHNRFV